MGEVTTDVLFGGRPVSRLTSGGSSDPIAGRWITHNDAWDTKPADRHGRTDHGYGFFKSFVPHNRKGYGEQRGTARVYTFDEDTMTRSWMYLDEYDQQRVRDILNHKAEHNEQEYIALIEKYGPDRVDALLHAGKAYTSVQYGKFGGFHDHEYRNPSRAVVRGVGGAQGNHHGMINLAYPTRNPPRGR